MTSAEQARRSESRYGHAAAHGRADAEPLLAGTPRGVARGRRGRLHRAPQEEGPRARPARRAHLPSRRLCRRRSGRGGLDRQHQQQPQRRDHPRAPRAARLGRAAAALLHAAPRRRQERGPSGGVGRLDGQLPRRHHHPGAHRPARPEGHARVHPARHARQHGLPRGPEDQQRLLIRRGGLHGRGRLRVCGRRHLPLRRDRLRAVHLDRRHHWRHRGHASGRRGGRDLRRHQPHRGHPPARRRHGARPRAHPPRL